MKTASDKPSLCLVLSVITGLPVLLWAYKVSDLILVPFIGEADIRVAERNGLYLPA